MTAALAHESLALLTPRLKHRLDADHLVAIDALAGRGVPALVAWGEDRALGQSAAASVCLLTRRPAGTADPRSCG